MNPLIVNAVAPLASLSTSARAAPYGVRASAIGPEAIAALARRCLLLELATYPKPGLVSPVDKGSHADMDVDTFRASARAIEPYLADLAEAGARRCGMDHLRRIGLAAEAAMLSATEGVNTHRGAIFGLGLLCAAAGARSTARTPDDGTRSLGEIVCRSWGRAILADPVPLDSHGGTAFRRYGAGGARHEAAHGFPTLYAIGLPALWFGAKMDPGDGEAARVQACFALIAALEDTNLLHRAGSDGLRFARKAAAAFLDVGGVGQVDWRDRAIAVHQSFVTRCLSPGGSADMLAMSLFVQAFTNLTPT